MNRTAQGCPSGTNSETSETDLFCDSYGFSDSDSSSQTSLVGTARNRGPTLNSQNPSISPTPSVRGPAKSADYDVELMAVTDAQLAEREPADKHSVEVFEHSILPEITQDAELESLSGERFDSIQDPAFVGKHGFELKARATIDPERLESHEHVSFGSLGGGAHCVFGEHSMGYIARALRCTTDQAGAGARDEVGCLSEMHPTGKNAVRRVAKFPMPQKAANRAVSSMPNSDGMRRSTSTLRVRFMGGSLKYPLARLTGQCTKISAGVIENDLLSADPSPSSSRIRQGRRSSLGLVMQHHFHAVLGSRSHSQAPSQGTRAQSPSLPFDGDSEEPEHDRLASRSRRLSSLPVTQFSRRQGAPSLRLPTAAGVFSALAGAMSPSRSPNRSPAASPLTSPRASKTRRVGPRGFGKGPAFNKLSSPMPDLDQNEDPDHDGEEAPRRSAMLRVSSATGARSLFRGARSPLAGSAKGAEIAAVAVGERASPEGTEHGGGGQQTPQNGLLPRVKGGVEGPGPKPARTRSGQNPGPLAASPGRPSILSMPVRRDAISAMSSPQRSGSGPGVEDVEDGAAEKEMRTRANTAFSVRMGCLLALLVPDVVTFLLFQVFWGGPVFVCQTVSVDGMALDGWKGEANWTTLGVLCGLMAGHLLFLVSEVRSTGREGRSGLRTFLSPERQGGWRTATWNLIHILVVAGSVGVLAGDAARCSEESAGQDLREAGRLHRVHLLVHLLRCVVILHYCARLSGTLRTRLQSMVSMNKRRFKDKDQKLDLDLTYICDRLIAMALPCVRDAMYRNDMQMVARFFASKHYGHFVVNNLCNAFEEGGNGNYDQALLYQQVQRLPMHDHNAPLMQTLVLFLESAVAFLNLNRNNVIAVHCRGGKGRTGTFCSALMLWVGCCQTAEEAMELFAKRRTRPSNKKTEHLPGVDAPCQKRCLRYLERMIYEGVDILAHAPLILTKVKLRGLVQGGLSLCLIVEEKGVIVFDSGKAFGALPSVEGLAVEGGGSELELAVEPLALAGDVTVRVFLMSDDMGIAGVNGLVSDGGTRVRYYACKGRQIAFVQFHTAFHGGALSFAKAEVDGAYQDAESRLFGADFSVDLALCRGDELKGVLDKLRSNSLGSRWANSCADYEVTGCLPSALGAVRGQEQLDALMARLCARVEEVRHGEVVFDSRACVPGELCFVESGQVGYRSVQPRLERAYGRLGIAVPPCPVMGSVGAGSLLGMAESLLGEGANPFGTVYVAKTEVVQVRRVVLPRGVSGPAIPTQVPSTLSAQDLEVVFKKMAQALSTWSMSLAQQLIALTEQSNVKHEYAVGMERAERAALVKQTMEKYQIPVNERVSVLCEASLERQEDGRALAAVHGHLLLFQRYVVFVPAASALERAAADVLVSVRSISHTRLEKEKLVICFSQQPAEGNFEDNSSDDGARPLSPRILPRRAMMAKMGKMMSMTSMASMRSMGSISSEGEETALPRPQRDRRKRSVHDEAWLDTGSDHTLVFAEGMETALRVQEAIEKLRQRHSDLPPPPLLLGSADEFRELMRYFALQLPDEDLSEEESQALFQLMSPSRRKRFPAGAQMFAQGDMNQVIFFVLSGTVSIRRGNAVLTTMRAGELVGEQSFWGHGNRGKGAQVIAETDALVQWLQYENLEILATGRPLVAARIARCLAICIARRIQSQLSQLQQLEQAICSEQDLT